MICDFCDFKIAHTYCCGFGESIPNDDWICDFCEGLVPDPDDEEDDDAIDDDDVSDDEVDFLQFQARSMMPGLPNRIASNLRPGIISRILEVDRRRQEREFDADEPRRLRSSNRPSQIQRAQNRNNPN